MATFNPRRFARPECLKAVTPHRLLAFLNHFREYLDGRIRLPERAEDGIPYSKLATVLMSPDESAPERMVDALYLIHEMAAPDSMEILLKAAGTFGLDLSMDADASPADVALQIWLLAPGLLERKHAESQVSRPRSFRYFCGTTGNGAGFSIPTTTIVRDLEIDLDSWFAEHKRGVGSKVFLFDDGVRLSMMIRHGMPVKREGAMKDGQSSSVFYRPEKHDVLVYSRSMDEIGIHTGTKGERELYLRKIGQYFFGDPGHFPRVEKYRLDPLRDDGQAALVCTDVPGLERVTLLAISNAIGGDYKLVETSKATDLFAAMEMANRPLIPADACPVRAVFEIQVADSKTVRKITLCPPNVAIYTRGEESPLVEEWLLKRGFIISPRGYSHAHGDAVLAGP
ncbi:MAG: hypothetical protein HQL59_06365 [Magnetococcales bacterium]|nr:hypothetical protein [Magnetococcales bacterium]